MAVFMHIDMDAFYAAVEALDHPQWRGKPIIVGADPREGKGRGVVSTASYEARKFGVHSAMPIRQAWRRCPQGVYVRPRMGRYKEVSDQIMEIFLRFTPRIQPISLDEAFLDATGCERLFGVSEQMARRIKKEVFDCTGLTCSVGISAVKSVAKIASDMEKPDGLTKVPAGGEKAFLAPLEVRRLWGVGPVAARILARANIHFVADIQNRSRKELIKLFGKAGGEHYWNMANAIDPREVHDDEAAKSISHETTFLADEQDPEVLHRTLLWLADKVATRLRRHGVMGRIITLKYRTESFRTFTRRKTLSEGVIDTTGLYETAGELLGRLADKSAKVRLLGIGASGLEKAAGVQRSLFENGKRHRDHATETAIDQVRQRFGPDAIVRGSLLEGQTGKEDEQEQEKEPRE
ncbi:MAG: DNA polymerase IV [Planctomycetota bacterium]|jgi:DNA polymerase-4